MEIGSWKFPSLGWFHENGPKALVQHALRSLMLFIASRATKLGEEGGNEAREFARDVLEPMVLAGVLGGAVEGGGEATPHCFVGPGGSSPAVAGFSRPGGRKGGDEA